MNQFIGGLLLFAFLLNPGSTITVRSRGHRLANGTIFLDFSFKNTSAQPVRILKLPPVAKGLYSGADYEVVLYDQEMQALASKQSVLAVSYLPTKQGYRRLEIGDSTAFSCALDTSKLFYVGRPGAPWGPHVPYRKLAYYKFRYTDRIAKYKYCVKEFESPLFKF